MLTSRSAADRRVTSRPPIRICPSLAISSPAISRKVVVLPQPDGPSSVTSVAGWIVNETALTAVTSPYRLVTARNSTDAGPDFMASFRQAADFLFPTFDQPLALGRCAVFGEIVVDQLHLAQLRRLRRRGRVHVRRHLVGFCTRREVLARRRQREFVPLARHLRV